MHESRERTLKAPLLFEGDQPADLFCLHVGRVCFWAWPPSEIPKRSSSSDAQKVQLQRLGGFLPELFAIGCAASSIDFLGALRWLSRLADWDSLRSMPSGKKGATGHVLAFSTPLSPVTDFPKPPSHTKKRGRGGGGSLFPGRQHQAAHRRLQGSGPCSSSPFGFPTSCSLLLRIRL